MVDLAARPRPKRAWVVLPAIAAAAAAVVVALLSWGSRPSPPTTSQVSSAAQAVVGGVTYSLGVARDLSVQPSDLKPFGTIDSGNSSWAFSDTTAYSLVGVDPRAALVVHAKAGLSDDFGPWGEWLILWGNMNEAFPAVCTYFDAGSSSMPSRC
jgi:hypothetical protein